MHIYKVCTHHAYEVAPKSESGVYVSKVTGNARAHSQFTKCRFHSQNHACTRVAETHRNVHVQVFVQHTNHILTVRKQHIITQCLAEYLAHACIHVHCRRQPT